MLLLAFAVGGFMRNRKAKCNKFDIQIDEKPFESNNMVCRGKG